MEKEQEQMDDLDSQLPQALIASFNNAMKYGRIRLGLGDSVELLDIDPKSIVMCVVPYISETSDPLKHLNVLLMEAFCREHSVRLVKVTSMEGFCSLLRVAQQVVPNSNPLDPFSVGHYDVAPADLSDLIIIEATNDVCNEDENLKTVYDCKVQSKTAPPILPPVFPTFFEA